MKYFRLKDLFTTLNLFLTFCSMALLYMDQMAIAALILFVNVVVIDILDGLVARLTKTSNDFGKFFDSITDFIGCSVAPSLFVFKAFFSYNRYLAILIAFLPLFFGVVRNVQHSIEQISHTHFFIGFPRSASGLLIIAFLNSSFLQVYELYWVGVILIVVATVSNLSHWPYLGNNKEILVFAPRIKVYLFFAVLVVVGYTYLGIFWDAVTIFLVVYLISPPIIEEKKIFQDLEAKLIAHPK